MAVTFALVASLATVGGGWAVRANQFGRIAALIPASTDNATQITATGTEAAPDSDDVKSPETYIGYVKIAGLRFSGRTQSGRSAVLSNAH
jgi:hypothetical protein